MNHNHALANYHRAVSQGGLDAKKTLFPAGGEVFSLDIPFYRTPKAWKREA
jgi:hypothetical protein